MPRLLTLLALLVLAAAPTRANDEFFEKRIRPILATHCYGCHSAEAKEPKSGLRLDSRAGLLKGGARGPAIVPGSPEKSRLFEAISYKNVDLQMPPRGKLPESAIADLTTWIKSGATWPGSDAPIATVKSGFDLQKRKAEHWAWHPVKVPPIPQVKDTKWPIDDIDRFILAKLEATNQKPASPADRLVWLRRVYLDLIGLPPSVDEILSFEAACGFAGDTSAMQKTVDRLLASPHYGERWARHWLDLVRYAETKGHEFDPIIPNAYQYRDYVIRAFNADVPYNQFVTEHIAGDLLPKPRMNPKDDFNESILGTGFWFLGEEVHSPVDIRGDEADRIDNKIDVFSKTFLALTVSCARCHDHKFDAISQKDYYALSGFILSSAYRQVRFDSMENNKRIAQQLFSVRVKHRRAILQTLAETIKPGIEELKDNLLAARAAIRGGKSGDTPITRAWVKYLATAAKNPFDQFHDWADLCSLEGKQFSDRIDALTKMEKMRIDDAERNDDETSKLIATSVGALHAPNWRANEVGFTQFGADWGIDPRQPVRRLQSPYTYAFDTFWGGLSLASQTEMDHGALGASPRYSHLLRTPNFILTTGKLFVSVRGKGKMYAAVDSHSLIAGPLHGRLIRDFDTKGEWQVVTYDLAAYKGHLLHLEIWPTDPVSFEYGFVEQRSSALVQWSRPPLLWSYPNIVQAEPPSTPEKLARLYQDWFRRAVEDLSEGDDESFAAWCANTALSHPELFNVKDFSKVVEVAKPLFDQVRNLAKGVRRESRLAPAIWDGSDVDARVHIRGSHKALGEEAPRRFLEALPSPTRIQYPNYTSARDLLAQQVTNPAVNPLIARVIVNRVWHHLFGRGIVPTVDNFGVMGEKPTHPELLDFLADRFVREGWSIKKLIRELVLSQTYRQSRSNLKRLEGEAIRDSMLAVSGRLDAKMFGPAVPIHLTEFLEGRGRPPVNGPIDGDGRRSVYLAVRRNFLSPFMLAFDTPAPFSTMGKRSVSNVPAQALILMNDPFVHQQAERWGKRVQAEPGDIPTKISRMYLQAFTRRPSADELRRSREFIEARLGDAKAWGDLAHVLFNVKEFIWVP